MSSAAVRFTPDILHSYPLLRDYLLGEKTDQRVKERVVEVGKYPENNWMGKCKVVPLLVSEIIRTIFAVYAKAISYLLFAIGLRTWSYQLDIHADIALYDPQLEGYTTYGDDFLAPALNVYSPDAIDLYLQPRLLKRDIRDERVRCLINQFKLELEFDKNDGLCRGESLWFIRHYFKTKALFENQRDHMRALGQLFSWGGPPEAALIQKLCPKEDLIDLIEGSPTIIEDTEPCDRETRCKKVAEEFRNLQPGAYYLKVPCHAMAYICAEKGQGYLFDPNMGTIAIYDQEGFEKLAAHVVSYQKYKKSAHEKLRQLLGKSVTLANNLAELVPLYPS